jgi:hypothetical protein
MTVIQSAYEREASSGSKLHDKGLRVSRRLATRTAPPDDSCAR